MYYSASYNEHEIGSNTAVSRAPTNHPPMCHIGQHLPIIDVRGQSRFCAHAQLHANSRLCRSHATPGHVTLPLNRKQSGRPVRRSARCAKSVSSRALQVTLHGDDIRTHLSPSQTPPTTISRRHSDDHIT